MSKTATQTASCVAILASLALLPIIAYVLLGYTGQDLPFHVSSWLDLRDGWLSGQFNPGWSDAANYGRGDPHLTLYPPVSSFLGAFLAFILPLQLAPGTFIWMALLISGLSMYAASKPFVAERDRLIAAVFYMLGPYAVTTSLVRFAAAELLVQAWLPLIALYFYRAVWTPIDSTIDGRQTNTSRAHILLVLLLGLSWITNIPSSIVLLYSLGITAVLRAFLQRSAAPIFRIVVAEGFAATLAAFYLLPVWKEQLWVHADTLLRFDPFQMLLFMPHRTFNDRPLIGVCWIFLCAQGLLAIACLRRRTVPLVADPAVPAWACLAAASIFLQSPLSIPIWQRAPELRFIQFPFRFLSILGIALPLLLLARGTCTSLRRPAYLLTVALSLIPFTAYLSEQAVDANRKPPLPQLLASWQRTGAPEYLPAGTLMPIGPANMPAVSATNPSDVALSDPACKVELQQQSTNLRVFRTVSSKPCRVRMMLYFYPYWRASDETGQTVPISRESTGFLLVDVPSGAHTVSVTFRSASPLRIASAIGSLITLLVLVAALMFNRPERCDSSLSQTTT